MIQKFRLKNLACAGCAAKMEKKISELCGVERCSISFMTSRLSITADEEELPGIRAEAEKIIRSIEPDCSIE